MKIAAITLIAFTCVLQLGCKPKEDTRVAGLEKQMRAVEDRLLALEATSTVRTGSGQSLVTALNHRFPLRRFLKVRTSSA